MKKLFNKKGGFGLPLELTELVIMIFLVVIGVFLLNSLSAANENSAQKHALVERNNYLLEQKINSLLIQPIILEGEKKSFAEILNDYFVLKYKDEQSDLSDDEENLLDELELKIRTKLKEIIREPERSTIITFKLYDKNVFQQVSLKKEFEEKCYINSNGDEKILPISYSEHFQIPTSISNKGNYQIMIELGISDSKEMASCYEGPIIQRA